MKDPRTESEIQTATVKMLKAAGFSVWSTSQTRASSVTKGVADLFVTGRGITAWVEIKAGYNKQTPEQEAFQQAVEANGGRYLLARNEVEVIEYLLALRAA